MAIKAEELDAVLAVLRKHDAGEFSDDAFTVKLNPKKEKSSGKEIALAKKTPEQEAEEILFYSAKQ